jgi:hypothetical protein
MLMVSDEKTDHIIRWEADLESFNILNKDELEKEVLGNYYDHNKFPSFLRQLNIYDFTKLETDNRHHRVYAHQYFKKSQPELLVNLLRKTNTQTRNPYRFESSRSASRSSKREHS